MGNRYLILSDLHLCDVEDHPDGWMYYKSSRFVFDDAFADLLDDFVSRESGKGPLTLILNGDVFDFDLVRAIPDAPPWPVSRAERKRGLDATEEKSVWKLERILSHHPRFVHALVGFLSRGHRLVYVMGNHDREFHFPAVRQAFLRWLRGCAQDCGGDFSDDAVHIEPWFFVVPGEIYVEHGHQYDSYTTFRHLLSPTVEIGGKEMLAIPMGNLANRYLMTRMGFFNPHSSDYILNTLCYLKHWWKHYALTRRSLALTWFTGSLAVIFRSLQIARQQISRPPNPGKFLSEVARRYRLDPATLRALYRLQRPPITTHLFRMVRELWMDRVLMVVAIAAGIAALWASSAPPWAKLAASVCLAPAIMVLYEKIAEGETIFSIEERLPHVARAISRLLPVRVVAFGHTHVPRMIPLSRDVTYLGTGAWAPVTRKRSPDKLELGYRDYARVAFDGGAPTIVFDSWLEDSSRVHHLDPVAAPSVTSDAFSVGSPRAARTPRESGGWKPEADGGMGIAARPAYPYPAQDTPEDTLPVSSQEHPAVGRAVLRPSGLAREDAGGQGEPWWTPASWIDEGKAATARNGAVPASMKTAEWDVLLSGAP